MTKGANAIDTRERQQHLDDAISKDNNGDFLCGSQTMKRQRQLETGDTQRPLCRLLGRMKQRASARERHKDRPTEGRATNGVEQCRLDGLSAEEAC